MLGIKLKPADQRERGRKNSKVLCTMTRRRNPDFAVRRNTRMGEERNPVVRPARHSALYWDRSSRGGGSTCAGDSSTEWPRRRTGYPPPPPPPSPPLLRGLGEWNRLCQTSTSDQDLASCRRLNLWFLLLASTWGSFIIILNCLTLLNIRPEMSQL